MIINDHSCKILYMWPGLRKSTQMRKNDFLRFLHFLVGLCVNYYFWIYFGDICNVFFATAFFVNNVILCFIWRKTFLGANNSKNLALTCHTCYASFDTNKNIKTLQNLYFAYVGHDVDILPWNIFLSCCYGNSMETVK